MSTDLFPLKLIDNNKAQEYMDCFYSYGIITFESTEIKLPTLTPSKNPSVKS